ncbi:MAG: aldehyde dehydrogenase family protein [Ignavibacteria bacterium]|nr:aldehyde dehydrogenase family protein [Ignavibacteria bacterium]
MEAEKYLIGNQFYSSDYIVEVKNPYSNEVVKKYYKTPINEINTSLDYLNEVYEKFKRIPIYQRAQLIERITSKLQERKEELSYLLTLETGKPIKLSRIELERAIFTFKCGAEEAKRIQGEIIDLDQLPGSEGKKGYIKRFPIGIVLAITPWNFPVNLVVHKISPALASGNVVLLKPASASLGCGLEIGRIIKEVCDEMKLGFTPVNVVVCSGSEIESFASDERVKMVSFTGSPLVGWNLKKKISTQRISLELGGNAGVIVDESADLKLAVSKIIMGGFAHAGQSCISVQRVYVHEKIFEKFKNLIFEDSKKIKFGNPFEEDTIVGPMINETEAKRVEDWIKEALDSGGKIFLGGNRKGALLEPTIMLDVPKNCSVNCKEVFAPLITLQEFSDFKDAISQVNDSDYGLQAGVFTNNFANVMYAFENIETGGIVINDVSTYRMDSMPYGGVKRSGIGREGVKYAIEEMTERKILVVQI